MEIDPLYVDAAIRRWQRYTGEYAVHIDTGRRFDDAESSKKEAALVGA
jgi:DNA modification methylase